jgi:DNA-binding IclR family transcriptional regulator
VSLYSLDAVMLQKHVRDLHGLLARGDLQDRAEEMVRLVEQKRAPGLISAAAPTFDVSAPLVYAIAVASHNPRSQRLRDALLGSVWAAARAGSRGRTASTPR